MSEEILGFGKRIQRHLLNAVTCKPIPPWEG
jgi:hypothetical protein